MKAALIAGLVLFEKRDVVTGGDHDQKDGAKGFAGLSSMVSDVDATVSEAGRRVESAPTTVERATPGSPAPPSTSHSTQETSTYQSPPQPSGGSPGKWFLGIAVVIGLIWLASLSDKTPSVSSPAYSPPTEAPAVAAAPPVWQPTPSPETQVPSRPTENRPPVGSGNTLTSPQLRYCTAENIRLDAAKTVINSYSDAYIDRFNALVADYNSRCGQFRYRRGALESARADVEQNRTAIEEEGRSRFARAQVPVTSIGRNSDTSSPKPDLTVQAIQRRLNKFGYRAGVEDGFVGKQTRAAIASFQRDENIGVDGKPSLELLKRLSEYVVAPPASTAPRSTPPSPAQPIARVPAQDAPRAGGIPPNAELDYYGKNWTCKRGFKRIGDGCEQVSIPANAELDYYGRDWTCKRGFKRVNSQCLAVQIPPNAELDYYGRDWTCKRGFKRVNDGCEQVAIPANAELDYYGRDWTCKRGFKRVNSQCLAVQIPPNAELDYYGRDWACKKSFIKTSDGCSPI